jgi:hypothetical protein
LASSIESLNYHARTVSISNTITDSNEDLTYTIVLPSSPRQPTTSTVRTVQSAPLFWKSVYRPTELTSFDELLSIECIHPRNLRLHAAVARSAALPEKSVGSGDANQSRRQSLNFDVPITSTGISFVTICLAIFSLLEHLFSSACFQCLRYDRVSNDRI